MEHHQTVARPHNGTPGCWATVCVSVRAGGGGGGRGGLQPPQLQKCLKFFGQNADGSGKSTREKTLRKAVKARLEGYFLHVCLVKSELRPNDRTIQVICFGKAMYRLHVFRRNPRDGYYFHEQKNDIIKTRKDLDVFVVALKRPVFSGFTITKSCFKIILSFT